MDETIEKLKKVYGSEIEKISEHSEKYFVHSQVKTTAIHVHTKKESQEKEANLMKMLEYGRVGAPRLLSSKSHGGLYINEFSIVEGVPITSSSKDIDELTGMLFDSIEKLHSVKNKGFSLVHGDLSPRNVLVGREIRFIDLSHSFFGEPDFDYAYLLIASFIYERTEPKFSSICKRVYDLYGQISKNSIKKYLGILRNQDRFDGVLSNNSYYNEILMRIDDPDRQYTMTPKREVVNVNVGISCNNNCIFCSDSDKKNTIDSERIVKQIIDNSGAKNIQFVYSEPTLNPDLIQHIRLAKVNKYSLIGLSTNGRMLSYGSYLSKLLESGVNEITLSVHGHNEKMHDSLTRSPGSFKQTTLGIRRIMQNKLRRDITFNISTTITSSNLEYMKEILLFVKQYSPDSHVLNIVEPRGYAKEKYDSLSVKYSEFVSVLESLGDEIKGFNISIPDMPYCAAGKLVNLIGSREEQEGHQGKLDYDSGKVKRAECTQCCYNKDCGGVWEDYIKRYGWGEFKPVKPTQPVLTEIINFHKFLSIKLSRADLYPPCELYTNITKDDIMESWKRAIGLIESGQIPGWLGLFVGIPFCRSKCFFCQCHSKVGTDDEIKEYLGWLNQEIDGFSPLFRNLHFDSFYIGGGTPSILDASQLDALLNRLRSEFKLKEDSQIIFEATPASLDNDKVTILKRYGVNRVTLGVQSMDPEVLKTVNRNQTCEQVKSAVKAIKSAGIRTLNLDLIGGLEGQSKESFIQSLKEVIAMDPDIIHIYPFSPSENTIFTKSGKVMGPAAIRRRNEMIIEGNKLIQEAGYKDIEYDSLGKHDHDMNYQEGQNAKYNCSILGIGSIAKSHIFGECYYHSNHYFDDDIKRFPYAGTWCSMKDEMSKYIIWNLRKGVNTNEFWKLFKRNLFEEFNEEINLLESMNKIEISKGLLKSKMKSRKEHLTYTKVFYSKEVVGLLRKKFSGEYEPDKDYEEDLNYIVDDSQ